MDKVTDRKGKSAAVKMLFTALLLLTCAAIYILTESSYNRAQTEAVESAEPTTTGVFIEGFCKVAFASTQYEKTADNVYEIREAYFDNNPRVVLSAPQGIVRAFTCILDMPSLPEEEEEAETPIEKRLSKEREAQYIQQCAWLEKLLPQMMRALDAEERLTQSDILFLLHSVDTVIESGKQQNLIVAQYRVRIYTEEKAGKSKLSISLQDESNLEEK